MLKKILKMAMTFLVLAAAYTGYSTGFALLASRIARPRTVPELPKVATQSRSLKDAIALAEEAFGPNHWAVKAELHYYDELRGYWMYYRNQERLDDGKTWEFSPVAVVVQAGKGKNRELKTITGKKARINFNRAFDAPGPEPSYVTHALIQGDVRIRADKGTPSIADDLVIGPQESLEYDEKRAQITSQGDERIVLVEKGTTVTGLGLTMDMRRKAPVTDPRAVVVEGAAPPPTGPAVGFDGVKTIILHRDVAIDVESVSQSGIVPGGNKVVATSTKDGTTKPAKVEPRPGHVQSAGAMRIELPRKHNPPGIGPPAPPEPTFVFFDRNVRLQQGSGVDLDQLDCDHFEAMLLPPEPTTGTKAQVAKDDESRKKSAVATSAVAAGPATKGQPKADPADDAAEEQGGSVANLTLRRAKATGHAVWFQSGAQHMVAYGNYLRFEKFGVDEPDCTYFYGDKYTEVVQTNVYATGKDVGKPRSIETIRTKDITIYRYPEGGPAPSVVARGPGTQETRAAGSDVIERFSSWQDEARIVTPPGSDERRVTLLGHPRVRNGTQDDMTADKEIIADLEPKEKAKDATDKSKLLVVAKDGKPVPPRDPRAVAEGTPEPAAGDAMRIKHVRAVGNVLLVTKERLADPDAKPPRKAVSRREVRARNVFDADFVDLPADPPKPEVAAKPDEPKPEAAEPRVVAQTDPDKLPPPPDPAMTAIADSVHATVLRKAGSENSQVSEAKLIGAAEVHQDPKEGKAVGTDMTGGVIFLKNGGENRLWVQAQQGTSPEPATAITDGRNIRGPIVTFDQARDYAWVVGWGRLEMEQADSDFLDGSAPVGNEVASADGEGKDPTKPAAPGKKKGPLVINWGTGPDDKAARMFFHGRTTNPDGSPGPAQVTFYSHVRARTDDSSADSEKMTATFDAPIPFVKVKGDPADAPPRAKGEKPPGPQIATILFEKDADVIARQVDPGTGGFLKDKKRIIHQKIFYDKATGEFTAKNGPGEVYLYTTDDDDKDKGKAGAAPGPLASDRRIVKPTSARVEAPKAKKTPATQPQLTLTHVIFQKQMKGRFTPPKDARPGDYNNVYFEGSVETMMAKVKDENSKLDPDNPPDDFYRLVSREMTVNIEPPPVKGKDAKDRTLLDAWGDPEAQTRQKTIKGERITYDSLSELTYVYGGVNGVNITNQDGAGQPYTNGRGETVKHNHKTNETQVINPKTFNVIQPNTGVRSALVPVAATPRNVAGLAAPGRPVKVRDPNDPVLKARQLRMPPRADKERRGFSGR